MSDQPMLDVHQNKNVNITPETSVSVGVIALIVGVIASAFGLILGGALSYGATSTKIDYQGRQIQELTEGFKKLTDSLNAQAKDSVRQEEVNKQFAESLSDIKSILLNRGK